MGSKNDAFVIARIVACVMLIAALGHWPYGYYQLLRLVVTGVSGWGIVRAHQAGRAGWAWAFGIVALFFQPVFALRFARDVWEVLNIAAAAVLGASLFGLRRR